MVEPFITPIPDEFLKDPSTAEYHRALALFLDDLARPEGALATSETTTATVLTHAEKLDFLTITQDVDADAVEADTAASKASLATLLDSPPTYTLSNDTTDRSFNANRAAGTISNPPTKAEVENLRDAILELADVEATHIRDMASKTILGT